MQVSCLTWWHNLPDHLSLVLQEYCFVGYVQPPVVVVLSAVGPFVGGVHPSGWLTIRINLNNHVCTEVAPQGRVVPSRV